MFFKLEKKLGSSLVTLLILLFSFSANANTAPLFLHKVADVDSFNDLVINGDALNAHDWSMFKRYMEEKYNVNLSDSQLLEEMNFGDLNAYKKDNEEIHMPAAHPACFC